MIKILRNRRHVMTRGVVASALLTSTVILGVTGAASAAAATHLVIVPGYQTTVASGAFFSPVLVVQLQDGASTVDSANTTVVTATVSSGGQLANATATAVAGVATFTTLKLNALIGSYTITFSDGALTPASTTSIAVTIGVANALALTTPPSTGAVSGVVLAHQPVIKLIDSGGNVETGVSSGTSVATIASGVGVVTAGSVASFVNGVATFSGLTLTGASGTINTLSFSGPQPSVVSGAITMSGPATQMVITTQPSVTGSNGVPLAQQPVVKIEDVLGNVVVADSSTVVALINGGGTSTLTSGAVIVVNGVATFSGLALNAPVGSYTLTFANGTFTAGPSTAIVLSAGAPSKLVVTTEPSTFVASGVAMAQQPVIKVEDALGNVVISLNTGTATAAISSGIGGAVSSGASANFVNGVATFSGLSISGTAANTYTLVFTGASLSIVDTAHILIGTAQSVLSVNSTTAIWGRSLTLSSAGGSGSGAVSFTASVGTATGCTVTGAVLTYSSTGTCIVTATKAADATYVAATSAPASILVIKLPIPGVVRVMFAANSSNLSAGARGQLNVLANKLTARSQVAITGFAPGKLALAQARATAVVKFLQARVHAGFVRTYSTGSTLQAAQIRTTAQ